MSEIKVSGIKGTRSIAQQNHIGEKSIEEVAVPVQQQFGVFPW